MDPRIPRFELIAENDGRVRIAEGRRSDGPVLEGHLRNISTAGALIVLLESQAHMRFLDEGEMIKMELALPERGRFAFFATVIRLEPSSQGGLWELGVQFRNLPSELARIIDHAVTPLSQDYSHPLNFELAAARGSTIAATRSRIARWRSLARALSNEPRAWAAVLLLILASLLSAMLN